MVIGMDTQQGMYMCNAEYCNYLCMCWCVRLRVHTIHYLCVMHITFLLLCSIAATQKAAQSKITVEDQIKAIQEAQGLL